MKVAMITTDGRTVFTRLDPARPSFGTAPESLMQGFAALGNEVELHVISTARKLMDNPEKLAPNIWFHQPLLPSWGMGKSLFIGSVMAVRKRLSEIQPDIVHGQGTEKDCALGAVFSGFPNVLTIHGNMRIHAKRVENKGKGFYRLAAMMESVALRLTDGVVSISSYTDDLVKPLTAQTWLLPNAADLRYFAARHSPVTPPTLLFVGGLDERKNPMGFIKACGDLIEKRGWRFRLCGVGEHGSAYAAELQRMTAGHHWIDLAGWKSREELLTEMEQASLLVLPTFEDNCPMVVLEAMAVGLPVIASKVGGVPDLITEGKTGMMFDPSSMESMQSVTAKMIDSPELRVQIGQAAKKEALQRFHPKVVAQAHLEIYRKILDR